MSRLLIHNVHIVNEGIVFLGYVVVNNDLIESVGTIESLPQITCEREWDGQGAYLLPGGIDEHVHFREPGLTQKADILSESRAAAAGGITSIMDMPNTKPQTTTLETLVQKQELMARECTVNYSCYFGATNHNAHLLPLLDRHSVCGIKVFMGASTGNMLVENEQALRNIFSVDDMLVAVHCESQNLIKSNMEKWRQEAVDGDLPVDYHARIRSDEVCYASSSYACRLATELGTRLHVLHVSSVRELDLFKSGKNIDSKRITAEACIGYLAFTCNDYARKGSLIKVNPAIKETDTSTFFDALKDGRLDTVATDHAPHLLKDKIGGALKATSGMPIIQYSLLSMLEFVHQGKLELTDVVEKMCHNPARLYNISVRGFIRAGYKADLVIVSPSEPWIVTNSRVLSKCGWTPLSGCIMHWRIQRTYINGHEVYDGTTVDDTYRGEALYFQ